MLDVGIRSVEDSDEAVLDAIYQACIDKRPDIKGVYTSGVLDLTVPESQRKWKAEGFPVLVATLGASPVGIAWLIPDEECLTSPFICEVAIMVTPSLHRQAIANQLWKSLISHSVVAEKRLHVIVAKVASTNAQAINACLKAGFRHTGSMPQTYCTATSRTLRDILYFELIIRTSPPDVSDLGWSTDYPGRRRTEKLLSNLDTNKLVFQHVDADAEESVLQGICDISSHLTATALFPFKTRYGPDHMERIKHNLRHGTIIVVVLDNKRNVVGHAGLRRGTTSGDEVIVNALLYFCLPQSTRKEDIITNMWSMLLEANQALDGLRIGSVYAIAAREDQEIRYIFENILGLRKAYTRSSEFIKFGKLHDTLTYHRQLEAFTPEQIKHSQVAHKKRNAVMLQEEWQEEEQRLELVKQKEQKLESWSGWLQRTMGKRAA